MQARLDQIHEEHGIDADGAYDPKTSDDERTKANRASINGVSLPMSKTLEMAKIVDRARRSGRRINKYAR